MAASVCMPGGWVLPPAPKRVSREGRRETGRPGGGEPACGGAVIVGGVCSLATPRPVACQAPVSMGFPRQEYCLQGANSESPGLFRLEGPEAVEMPCPKLGEGPGLKVWIWESVLYTCE